MRRLLLLSGVALAAMVNPAAAYWIEVNGSYTYIPDGLIVVGLFAAIIVILLTLMRISARAEKASATDLSEQYESKAAQYRAMSRKLDAETDLAERVIRAKRTRAELDDIEEMFKDGKPRRRR